MNNEIIDKVNAHMEMTGLSLQKTAKAIDIHISTIKKIIQNNNMRTILQIKKIETEEKMKKRKRKRKVKYDYKKIKKMLDKGSTLSDIANEIGVILPTLIKIIKVDSYFLYKKIVPKAQYKR